MSHSSYIWKWLLSFHSSYFHRLMYPFCKWSSKDRVSFVTSYIWVVINHDSWNEEIFSRRINSWGKATWHILSKSILISNRSKILSSTEAKSRELESYLHVSVPRWVRTIQNTTTRKFLLKVLPHQNWDSVHVLQRFIACGHFCWRSLSLECANISHNFSKL